MTIARKRKSFGSNVPTPTQGLEIELNGDKVFKVRSQISGMSLLNVIAQMEGDDEGAAAKAMIDFVSMCFLKEDREEGMEYLMDSDPPITLDELQEIVQWLIGEYTGNDTDPSSSSTSGSEHDGSTTTEDASATVSTSETSTESSSQQ
ncbi:putative tail assembly protein [Gordonia phage GMA2]|uniref:Putative tail assembly protein n=1 Tax=Gordonia phage GMA2 TaxID=1647283 RepID=A0A0K0N6L0_9CAUD|nr:putative tail assembly protein [Gordonia phage GMA2]AKJ72564.1 putative tail assembly protein [Gordonia phage GMA2]